MKVLSLYSGTVRWNDDSHSKAIVPRITRVIKGSRIKYTFEATITYGDGRYVYFITLDGVFSKYLRRGFNWRGELASEQGFTIRLNTGSDTQGKLMLSAIWPEDGYVFDMFLEADWQEDIELTDEDYEELTKEMT